MKPWARPVGSLPHRQLRKARRTDTGFTPSSLPHRQLRKSAPLQRSGQGGSLPHRQLRNCRDC